MAEERADVATHPLPPGERLIVTVGVMMAVLLQVLGCRLRVVARVDGDVRRDVPGLYQGDEAVHPIRDLKNHGRWQLSRSHFFAITINFASSFPTSRNHAATSFTLSGAYTPVAPRVFLVITSSSPACTYVDS